MRKGYRKGNKYEVEGNTARIYLTNCDKYFICDLEDLEFFKKETWRIDNCGYAECAVGRTHITAHRCLMGKQEGKEIDHINRNKLDNRKSNLRFVTHEENMRNVDRYINEMAGIRKRSSGRYQVLINCNHKRICIGTFDTVDDAKAARKEAVEKYWGKQAEA